MTIKWLEKYERARPFAEPEAWAIFQFTAFSEAIGWALLLYGIAAEHYHMPGGSFAIPVGGSIHGTIVIAYFAIVITGYSSLGWSRKKALMAMLVSAPPFGTLAFESYAAKQRRAGLLQTYRQIVVRGVIAHKKTVLAVQPNSTAQWLLPGGPIAKHESPQQALSRHIQKLTGVSPRIGELLEITPLQSRAQDVLELYYMVENTRAFHVLDMTELASQDAGIDEIAYIDPHAREDFELRSFMRG